MIVIKRLLVYLAALFAGTLVYFLSVVVIAIDPILPWRFPPIALIVGMTFPGGAPLDIHFINHIFQTWFPFAVAYLTAWLLTKKRARWRGALGLYGLFILWSLVMVALYLHDVDLPTVWYIGMIGTIVGGAIGYLWLVAPRDNPEGTAPKDASDPSLTKSTKPRASDAPPKAK